MKKNFTLIELIVSLFLISTILFVLFKFFISISKVEISFEKSKKEIFFKNRMNVKLNTIFSKLSSKTFKFYTENRSLFFEYDRGIDPDPAFSAIISSSLFINKKKELILRIYSSDNKSLKDEVLAKNIKDLSFEFIYKKNGKIKTKSHWSKKKKELPSIIKIKLDKNIFAFFSPNMQSSITYIDKKVL